MAIDDILKALEDQAETDCDECVQEAKAHADHILSTAQDEAEEIKVRHVAQVARLAESKAAQKVNAARLEGKMLVSSVKGEGLESVFATAHDQLGTIRQGSAYQALLASLLDEALRDTSGEIVVHCNPADVAAVQQMLSAKGIAGDVVADDGISGGVLVEFAGGKILKRNTLEDRLDRARAYVQSDVAKVLLA